MDESTLDHCITKVNDYYGNCHMRTFLQFQGFPASGGTSPTDKPRKDGALSPVTSEKYSYPIIVSDGVIV
jgi:hypothetical protein